jgi:hypothetical protein
MRRRAIRQSSRQRDRRQNWDADETFEQGRDRGLQTDFANRYRSAIYRKVRVADIVE